MNHGTVFKIQKYSIHDGPGIRTSVFLKGCPLACWWCHNPEGRSPEAEVFRHGEKCIRCGRCGGKEWKASADACPSNALELVGREMTAAEVLEAVKSDLVFYEESGGGVTFTGGEPFLQAEFLQELLENCFREGIHTAVETSGYAAWKSIKDASAYTDLFLYDLKLMNKEKHMKYTGVSNTLILDNLERLAGEKCGVLVRIPLIPGINDDAENIRETGLYLGSIQISRVSILPYHNTGTYKYEQMGLPYKLAGLQGPDRKRLEEVAEEFRKYGIHAEIGG
jgi:pyruvate formate lyase activating enzyme